MKNFYNVWKKHVLKESLENLEEFGETATSSTNELEKNNMSPQDKKKDTEKQIDILNSEIKQQKEKLLQLPDLIKQNQEKLEQLKSSFNTLAETFPGNAAGNPSEGAVGPGSVPYSVLDEEELTEEEMEEACGKHEAMEEGGRSCGLEVQYEEVDEQTYCNECKQCRTDMLITEAKYKGRTVKLNKPMRGDVKKFKVFVRDPSTGNVKKVNFGDKKMRIKKSNPKRRKSFRARHHCENPGPKTKARYWSCKKW